MMPLLRCNNLPAMFLERAAAYADAPLLHWRDGRGWRAMSWRETAERALKLASALRATGLRPGDRMLLVSENRPEWPIADLAVQMAGGITVPAYVTNDADAHAHLLRDCGARLAFVSNTPLLAPLLAANADLNHALKKIILFDPVSLHPPPEIALLPLAQAVQAGKAGDEAIRGMVENATRGDLSAIIYTSGTGDLPVGVMHTHGNILHNCAGAEEILREIPGFAAGKERFLSFLPLSHAYERTVGQYAALAVGARIYYASRLEALMGDIASSRPTLMIAVPRLYQTMRARMMGEVTRKGGISARLFARTLALGRKRALAAENLTFSERMEHALLRRLVGGRVARRFGGALKAFISGGAPLEKDDALFLASLGFRILQGYGLTESGPVACVNRPRANRLGTVGLPLAGVEVRLASDGELLLRGELVMRGYWNDAARTADALREGWLHTGDIAEIDRDGFIRIIERKKDIIVSSGGDTIAPQRVENRLCLEPEIAQAVVCGDRKPHLVALIVADEAYFCTIGAAPSHAALQEAVARANASLGTHEKVRRFARAAEPFTVANGLLTPSMKVRRRRIVVRFASVIDGLYSQ